MDRSGATAKLLWREGKLRGEWVRLPTCRVLGPRVALAVLVAVVASCAYPEGGAVAAPVVFAAGSDLVQFAVDPAGGTALPSFNESSGCLGPEGVRGPYATTTGELAGSELIYGPWGDFFGRDISEVESQLVEVELPMPADGYTTGAIVRVHRSVLPALLRVVENLEAQEAAGNYYVIHRYETGSYRPATIAPDRVLSFHAVGAAIDINSSENLYSADNALTTNMPEWFVKAWTDAGWCWGGDWRDFKDAMHFSWQGPLYTGGYSVEAPATPRTTAALFTRSVSFDTALGQAPDGASLFVTDVDRDGAPDAVRVNALPSAGSLSVEAAQAWHGFETCWAAGPTSRPSIPGATLLLADGTGQGRPDLWEIDTSGGQVAITVHTFASRFSESLPPRATGVTPTDGATFLVGDHDLDGTADLYVVKPGDQVALEIWQGPDFTTQIVQMSLPAPITVGWQYALGDLDIDGVSDLYALSPDNPARLVVVPGAAPIDQPPPPTIITAVAGHDGPFQVGDLDGDGRDDLLFLDTSGVLTAYLGGDRGDTTDTQLTYWFTASQNHDWAYRDGCPGGSGTQ
jgi:hypothetical protein